MAGKNTARLACLKARRKRWLQVHLWLGLILGLFLSVFGITGSILVFHQEIAECLNPRLLTVGPPVAGAPYQPFERLQEAAEAVMSKDAKLTFANYPRNEAAALTLAFAVPAADDITSLKCAYRRSPRLRPRPNSSPTVTQTATRSSH